MKNRNIETKETKHMKYTTDVLEKLFEKSQDLFVYSPVSSDLSLKDIKCYGEIFS